MMAGVVTENETAQPPPAAAASSDKDNARPAPPGAKLLDPQLLMAARRGDWKELEHLLQLKLKGDDGSEDRNTRPEDEGSGTPTTAAASSTTTTSAAPSTSILQPHTILEMEQGQDTPPLPTQQPPAVPPAAGVLDADGVTMEGDSLLHVVAASGDTQNFLDCAKMIVHNKEKKGGADAKRRALEARNNKGDTPLHCAARAGNDDMIPYLVGRLKEAVAGAGAAEVIERKNECEETELQQAVSKAAVKAFVRRKNKCGETALHQAVRAASVAAIGKLLALDPELAALSQKEDDAAAASKADIGKFLAAHPELAACIRDWEDDDAGAACSPFYLAVSLWGEEDGEMDIASYLFRETKLSIRSNLSYYCCGPNDGRNVLHLAVSRASVKTVILLSRLLKSPGPLAGVLSQLASQRDEENGSTPLHLAASLDGLPSSLLVWPPHLLPPPPETTPLWPSSCKRTYWVWYCCFPVRITRPNSCTYDAASKRAHWLVARPFLWGRRYRQILPLMLSLVLNANVAMAYQPDKAGLYPIHVAAGSGSVNAVQMLLERCPDCATLRDAKGRTLLHVAAEEGRWFVVNYVCCHSSGLLPSILNAQDMNGDTPLHRAVQADQLGIVRRLIGNHQVRLDVANNKGMMPIDVSWTTLPREAYYAWDSRMMIRRSLLQLGAPYGENNRGDLFRQKCVVLSKKDQDEEKKISKNLTSAAQVLALFSVLITTVTFASAFTLPGGSRSPGDGVAGTPVLGGPRRSYAFDAFILADALAFGLSLLATTLLLYVGVPAGSLDNRFYLINLAYGLMWNSARSLLAAFGLGLFIVLLPVARSIAIAVVVLMVLLARTILKGSEGLNSLGAIHMIGIGRSRQLSRRDRVLGWIQEEFVFKFWSYVLIFGIPAIRRWPKFTLSPY